MLRFIKAEQWAKKPQTPQNPTQISEQNRTRDMEIKNKLTVTRGEGEKQGKEGEGSSRTM